MIYLITKRTRDAALTQPLPSVRGTTMFITAFKRRILHRYPAIRPRRTTVLHLSTVPDERFIVPYRPTLARISAPGRTGDDHQ